MPIKLKNIPVAELTDPLQIHLNNSVSSPKKSTASDKPAQVSQETEQTIKEYLSHLKNLRKENQLVYGRELGAFNLNLGLGLINRGESFEYPIYKKSLTPTATSIFGNEQYAPACAVEFGITYDNTIFIVPSFERSVANNLYKMAQGTLLKAVGCMQIGNRQIEESEVGDDTYPVVEGQINYISVYSDFFDVPKENIAVSLFVFQRLGIDLSDTKVVIPNDNPSFTSHASGCNITTQGEIKNATDYLDETRFPGAKALAEKNLTFFDKVDEFFCSIDDEIFLKRNKRLIEKTYGKKELLKLNLIKLFNCTEEFIKDTEKKAKVTKTKEKLQKEPYQPSTSLQAITDQNIPSETNILEEQTGSFNDYWQAIRDSIQFFKEQNVDLSFIASEINMLLAYILHNGLTPKEKNQLEELALPERIPGRGLDIENISPYIAFYDQDPVKTCMALLKDYSKGEGWQGVSYRVLFGAWSRNYKDSVGKLLSAYSKNELPDNITLCGIYEKLKDLGLMFNFDAESKSSLMKILLFCAKLNNEEEALRYLILDASLTLFPPLPPDDQDRCLKCF